MVAVGRFLKRHRDIFINLVGVIIGLALGFFLRGIKCSPEVLFWIGLPGTLYIRFLTMMIVPLAVASLISGTATFDNRRGGKYGCMLLLLVFLSNVISAATSLAFISFALKPGEEVSSVKVGDDTNYSAIFATLLRNFVPDNFFAALFQRLTMQQDLSVTNANHTANKSEGSYNIPQVMQQTPNMLGIVFMSIIFGIAAGCDKEKNLTFINLSKAVFNLALKIVSTLKWIIPLGTISLTASAIGGIDDLGHSLLDLGIFLGVLLAAVGLHQLFTLPLLVLLANRKNPLIVLHRGWRAWVLVFATSSSVQGMPEMFDACENLSVSPEEAEVGVPLAMMTNASGAGMYICSATYLLAYLQGVTFSTPDFLIVSVLSMTSAVSLNVVPSGALAGLIIVMNSMDLPTTEIGLLVAVEWIADRLRSPCNIMSVMSCVYATHKFTTNSPTPEAESKDACAENKPSDIQHKDLHAV